MDFFSVFWYTSIYHPTPLHHSLAVLRGWASPARQSQIAAYHPPTASVQPGRWSLWLPAVPLWPSGSLVWISVLPAESVEQVEGRSINHACLMTKTATSAPSWLNWAGQCWQIVNPLLRDQLARDHEAQCLTTTIKNTAWIIRNPLQWITVECKQ